MTPTDNLGVLPTTKNLKNKPLLEAILEIRWVLQSAPDGPKPDPFAKLLPGLLFSKLCQKYPVHEQLPQASLPDEVTYHSPQHRFRNAPNRWPLYQIGPGIITLNDTVSYEWATFRQQAEELIAALFAAHPEKDKLKIDSINLRYIDAVPLDSTTSVYAFLEKK